MRIIAGKARGIRLEAGSNPATRPTMDRLKETLFNMLGPVDGDVIVDVFAGSGALGLEALSRGAQKVYFIENDRATMDVIKANHQKVLKSMAGEAGKVEFLQSSWQQALRTIRGDVDVVISDPPYEGGFAENLLASQELCEATVSDAFMVIEHLKNINLENEKWNKVRLKPCGKTTFSFFEKT